jgi:hypothetical protein
VEPTSIDIPSSKLPSSLESSTDLEAVSPPRVLSSFVGTPTESVLGPTLLSTIAATPTLPTQPTITTVTESNVTPDVELTATPSLSSHPPSAPLSQWTQETNESMSLLLQASPSLVSMAAHEGPDMTFETFFLRPSGSMKSSADKPSPIPETPTAPLSLLVSPLQPFSKRCGNSNWRLRHKVPNLAIPPRASEFESRHGQSAISKQELIINLGSDSTVLS